MPVNGQIPEIYGIVVEGFSYTDLQTPLHDVLGHDGSPGRRVARRDGSHRDSALHGGGAAPGARGAAAAGADGARLSRRRRRRRHRAAHGRLSQGRIAHRDSDRRVSRRRHRRADLSRRRFPPRTRGGAPQHHRRVRSRDEDERDRVDAGIDLHALSRTKRVGRRGLLQREGTRPLLSRPAGRDRRRRPRLYEKCGVSAPSRSRTSSTSRRTRPTASRSTRSGRTRRCCTT